MAKYEFSNKTIFNKTTMGYMMNDNGKFHAYVQRRDHPEMVYMQPFDTPEEAMKEAARIIAEQYSVIIAANTRGIQSY